jgi:hypothetical protein
MGDVAYHSSCLLMGPVESTDMKPDDRAAAYRIAIETKPKRALRIEPGSGIETERRSA